VRGPDADGANAAPKADDVIVRSVELGYRVIDEYIKRGQAAARRMQQGTYGASDAARDVQGVAGQLVRSATDLAGAWAEFFALASRDGWPQANGTNGHGATTGNGHAPAAGFDVAAMLASLPVPPPPRPPTAPAASPAPPPPTPAPTAPLRVRLSVRAARPVETSLDVRPMPADHRLVMQALRTSDGARIDDVKVERGDGVAVIAVRIDAAQPAGEYVALVIDDATNVPVGELTIVLPPA
jgi:hypothetical protein